MIEAKLRRYLIYFSTHNILAKGNIACLRMAWIV